VTGGSDPHWVTYPAEDGWRCDCRDSLFAENPHHQCKHLLAVQMVETPKLRDLAERLEWTGSTLNLFALWHGSSKPIDPYGMAAAEGRAASCR
jgi:hypothetical protein